MCCYLSEPTMKNILKIVIPHIAAKWDDLAYTRITKNYKFKKGVGIDHCNKK